LLLLFSRGSVGSRHYAGSRPDEVNEFFQIIFGGAVNHNSNIFSGCFITISYPLHVSAPRGVFRWNICLSILRSYPYYATTDSLFLPSYQLYIYILVLDIRH
jgi:hypothetical protein